MAEIGQAIAAPFEHLEFVVEAFDKATGQQIVGNRFPVPMQSLEETIETGQATRADLGFPFAQGAFGIVLVWGLLTIAVSCSRRAWACFRTGLYANSRPTMARSLGSQGQQETDA